MALEFSQHKSINTSKDSNSLLLLNVETGYNINTEYMAIISNKNNNKINFITEARKNTYQEPFDKNISFLYHSKYATDSILLADNKTKANPRLHIFNKPFNIYRVYQLLKNEVLDFILVQDNKCFDFGLFSADDLHELQAYKQLLDMNSNNFKAICDVVKTNTEQIHTWINTKKTDYTILMGELLLSNAVFRLYRRYLLQQFSEKNIDKIYMASTNDFYCALILAAQKIKADINTTQHPNLAYKIWKITKSKGY